VNTNVRFNHGALGAIYPEDTYTYPNPYNCLKEGDTPSFLYFLNNGLNYPSNPSYGGWGGRFEPKSTYYQDANDQVNGTTNHRATVWRWRQDFQNDFQARMDWCVNQYSGANHNPIATVEGELERTVVAMDTVFLDASNSTDPDGNFLSYNWFVYSEPGSYSGQIVIQNSNNQKAYFMAPNVNDTKTLHVILSVKDNGQPSLVSYSRLIFSIIPSSSVFSISGNAHYYSNDHPIKDVTMSISTNPELTSNTNTVGYYEFNNILAGNSYVTESTKSPDSDVGFAVIVFDAAIIARAAIEIEQLADHQKIAADVSLDGYITTYDAALTAQYSVGIPKGAVNHAGDWKFLPESIVYPSLVSNQVDQKFTGILLGDVDGSWTQPGGRFRKEVAIKQYEKLKSLSANSGDELTIPLEIKNDIQLIAADIDFEYNPNVLEFVDIQRTQLIQDMQLVFNDEPGRLRAAIYGVTPINQAGILVNLKFHVKSKGASISELSLNKLLLNDNVLMKATSKLTVRGKNETPLNYELNQNYPNPFVPNRGFSTFPHQITNIKYQLPQKEKVTLKIYNYLGQEIKTLIDSDHEPGSYKVCWDGQDYNGQRVLPGLYFYKIIAGEFRKTKRMIILN